MKKILLQEDINLIETRLKQFEAQTGCELLLIVADASDPYPGASWRFGLLGAFFTTLIFRYYLDFHYSWHWPVSYFLIALFMAWVGHFNWAKRLALSDWEIQRECREKAIEYFHTMGTSQVSHKVTAMIMISQLEKNIQLLVDEKLKTKITQSELNELVLLMKDHFKSGNMAMGFVHSIEKLENKITNAFNGRASDANPSELSDTIHFVRLS